MADKKLSFAAELEQVVAESRREHGCAVAIVATELSPEDKAELALALANPKYTAKAIHSVLTRRGYVLSSTTVARHRRKECCCESW